MQKDIFVLLEKHLDDVLVSMGEDMEEFNTLFNMMLNDPVDLLPHGLQDKLLYPNAFRMAVEQNLLAVKRGRIVSNFSTDVLLAYLLGRLFSGDYPYKLCRNLVWVSGEDYFPSSELKKYFHVKNLRQLRQNRLDGSLPKGHQIVDNLFV